MSPIGCGLDSAPPTAGNSCGGCTAPSACADRLHPLIGRTVRGRVLRFGGGGGTRCRRSQGATARVRSLLGSPETAHMSPQRGRHHPPGGDIAAFTLARPPSPGSRPGPCWLLA